MKVLYVSSEVRPFAASGGLGDVAGSLPKVLNAKGVECRVVMPLYADIKPEWREKFEFVTAFTVNLAWRKQYCGLYSYTQDGVTYYFIDNEYYFKRRGLYGFFDDGERFAYFSRAVLEMLNNIDFAPDIINANDWQSGLVPVYLNLFYRLSDKHRNIRTVFTIHNIQYQGKYGMEMLSDVLGIDEANASLVEYDGCVNMMKGGMECADRISTVSPTYAQEVMDPWYSHGLDRFLRERSFKLCGILNGIDYDVFNPKTDPDIAFHMKDNMTEFKRENRKALREAFNLPTPEPEMPVIGIVSRLVAQKGIDLIRHVFEQILQLGCQVVVLGSGDYLYEEYFQGMRQMCPDRVGVVTGFFPDLAKKVYAGADIFLMPSKTEPCGLAQMMALRYGAIPVVRETGGLKDSITDCGAPNGNGFTFQTYNAHDMLDAISRAVKLHASPNKWRMLIKRAMSCDFSWEQSAQHYIDMYQSLL